MKEKTIDRILKIKEVISTTGLPQSTIYAMMAEDKFPRPVKLSVRSVGWRQSAIQKWIDALQEAC